MKKSFYRGIILAALAYFVTAKLGLKLSTFAQTSPIWPASGLAVSCLFLFGKRFWPSILIGSFAANFLTPGEILGPIAISLGNTIEAFFGAWLARRLFLEDKIPQTQRKLVAIILTGLFPTFISASIGVMTLTLKGTIPTAEGFQAWLVWWSGDALGVLAVLPLAFLWERKEGWNPSLWRSILALAGTSIASYLVFFLSNDFMFTYFLFSLLLLIGCLVGNLELKFAAIIMSVAGTLATTQGAGPFAVNNFSHDVVSLQILLAAILITSLALGDIKRHSSIRNPMIALMLGLGLTGLLSYSFKHYTDKHEFLQIRKTIDTVHEQLQENILIYENALTAAVGFMQSSPQVTSKEWANFLAPFDFLHRFPGILGMAVAYSVKAQDLGTFAKEQRLTQGIRQIFPGPPLPHSYVVTLIEPAKTFETYRGVDLSTEPRRREAFDLARDSGESTSTGILTMQNPPHFTKGFLLAKAFYKTPITLSTISERRKSLAGFVYSPISYDKFFTRTFRSAGSDLNYWVVDGEELKASNVVFSRDASPLPKKAFDYSRNLSFGDRTFKVLWKFSSAFVHLGTRIASWITLAGVLASLLITSLLLGFQNIFKRAQELAQEMTRKLQDSEDKIKDINRNLEEAVRERTWELGITFVELQKSEKNFRELADSMPQIVWISSAEGQNEYLNKRWYEFTGFTETQINESQRMQLIHPDDRQVLLGLWEKSLREKIPLEMQLRLWDHKQRFYRWFLSRSIPLFDDARNLKRWIGTSTDIHQQKLLEIELQKLSTLVENSPDAVLLFARNGEITYLNESAEALLGLRPGERRLIQDIFQDRIFFKDGLSPFMESEGRWNGEITLKNVAEGHGVITYSYAFQIQDKTTDSPLVTAFVARDISDLKSAELEKSYFRSREQAAVEASQIKSKFLANMSHEIRTPISGILGLTEILRRTSLTTEQKDLLKDLESSGRTLLELINDILDLSKIEAGKIEFEHIDFDLHDLLDGVHRHFLPMASEKKIELLLDLEGKLPRLVNGDSLRLKQVLMNLMSNAIKFSHEGKIILTSYLSSESSRDFFVHFSVRDEGIGIAPENQVRLFTPFTQADYSTSRKYGGTGLGLSISQHLVEGMGGQMGVKSDLGKGSTFWFKLQLQRPEGLDSFGPEDDLIALSDLRFLVAEDHPVNQRIIAYTLEELGGYVKLVGNGLEAIEALKTEEFDMLLIDCQMPIMDGYEAATRIRKGEAGTAAKRMPIVAVTANALKGDKEKCLNAGMNDFLPKPITSTDICKMAKLWIQDLKVQQLTKREVFSGDDHENIIEGFKSIFFETAPEALMKIQGFIDARDAKGVGFELHKLKSGLLALGFEDAAQLCKHMERQLPEENFMALEADFKALSDLVKQAL